MTAKKKRITTGDTVKHNGIFFIIDELFVADSVRWVRATTFRGKVTNTYKKRKWLHYFSENKYFTEMEWLRLKKRSQ